MSIAEQHFGGNKTPIAEILPTEFSELELRVGNALAAIAKAPAKVKNDADFAAVGDVAVKIRKFSDEVERMRKAETDPMFQAQKETKAYFDALIEKMGSALRPVLASADAYTREKAAEERRRREDEARKLREQEAEQRRKAEETTGKTAARAEGKAEDLAARAEQSEAQADASAADLTRVRTATGGVAGAKTIWAYRITDYDAIPLDKLRPYLKRDAVETAINSMLRVQKGNMALPGVEAFEDTKANFR